MKSSPCEFDYTALRASGKPFTDEKHAAFRSYMDEEELTRFYLSVRAL